MSLGTAVLDLLFPPKCPFCQRLLEDPRALLCPGCQRKLPWLTGRQGERRVDFADSCLSPLAYRDRVPDAVHRFKFSGVRAYALPFGTLMAQCARDGLEESPDLVTWAPLSRKRLRERGYDQAELLARQVGKLLKIPVVPLLKKTRHTAPQSGLEEASARRANALGAYELLPGDGATGKRVLLADDVVTSGATLSECARVLRQGGALRIDCLTLAQARGDSGTDLEAVNREMKN